MSTTENAQLKKERRELSIELESISNNSAALNEFVKRLELVLPTIPFRLDQQARTSMLWEFKGAAGQRLKELAKAEPGETHESARVEDVWFEVREQSLLHSFDLERFKERVFDLFKWHTDVAERSAYMAPYFPLVQSSGMGKTKLLFEFREYVEQLQPNKDMTTPTESKKPKTLKQFFEDCECKTILCLNGISDTDDKVRLVFSAQLKIPPLIMDRRPICATLDQILENCKTSKLVLLFDESQHLLANDGFYFRCVRWWLRLKERRASPLTKVVAVFTGTTSKLTNFYKEPPMSTTSRNANFNLYHVAGTSLYKPFHDICTIGLLATPRYGDRGFGARIRDEYEKAIPYGRPLLALMHMKKPLSKSKLGNVLRRMLLGVDDSWTKNLEACLSILGTRIQMGQTSASLASDLVAKGYAILSHYAVPTTQQPHNNFARLSFATDPVCARLGMCLMDEDWSLSTIRGQSKKFWVETMSKIFTQGLCLPNQGNLGELGGALYLLFCGDLLRKNGQNQQKRMAEAEKDARAKPKKDDDDDEGVEENDYTTFSVPLADFIDCMLKPNDFSKPTTPDVVEMSAAAVGQPDLAEELDVETSHMDLRGNQRRSNRIKRPVESLKLEPTVKPKPILYKEAHVGFIQVVANYLRFSIDEISQQLFLRGVYQSGCAFYVYPMCHVIDLIGSIRLTELEGNEEHYVPLLVSISTKHRKGSQQDPLDNMEQMLLGADTFGLCIRLLFARDGQQHIQDTESILKRDDVDSLLRGEIVSKVVIVPEDDPFGIVQVLLETTSLGPPECEVYSSHTFLQLQDPTGCGRLLRSKAKVGVKEYTNAMHQALWNKKEEV
jgi:hypothetical protein